MKDFAKNKLHTPQRAQETTLTSFALNQDNKKELNFLTRPDLLSTSSVLQWHGHPRVLGLSIPKTLVIGASPSHITLAIWVRVTGDAHITRCLRMGMPKTRGCPYHCDIGFVNKRSGYDIKTALQCNSPPRRRPWGLVRHAFVTNEPQRTSAGRLIVQFDTQNLSWATSYKHTKIDVRRSKT